MAEKVKSLKEALGSEFDDVTALRYFAVGMLFQMVLHGTLTCATHTPEQLRYQLREALMERIGKMIPGTNGIFTEQQADYVFRFFDQLEIGKVFLEWAGFTGERCDWFAKLERRAIDARLKACKD